MARLESQASMGYLCETTTRFFCCGRANDRIDVRSERDVAGTYDSVLKVGSPCENQVVVVGITTSLLESLASTYRRARSIGSSCVM